MINYTSIFSLIHTLRNSIFLVCGLLAAVFIFALREALFFRQPFGEIEKQAKGEVITLRKEGTLERWKGIMSKFAEGTPDAMKIAIINADKFVDTLLKDGGLEGEHMADRLEQLSADEIKTLDALWRAHRYRNNIVHTEGMIVDPAEAHKAMQGYEAFLHEIGITE